MFNIKSYGAAILIGAASINANANSLSDLDCIPVILEGYDVVEYSKLDYNTCDSVVGKEEYSFDMKSTDENRDTRLYQFWFANEENLEHFSKDPWRYVPKFGGFCSYGTCCETPETGDWPWTESHLGPPGKPILYSVLFVIFIVIPHC